MSQTCCPNGECTIEPLLPAPISTPTFSALEETCMETGLQRVPTALALGLQPILSAGVCLCWMQSLLQSCFPILHRFRAAFLFLDRVINFFLLLHIFFYILQMVQTHFDFLQKLLARSILLFFPLGLTLTAGSCPC